MKIKPFVAKAYNEGADFWHNTKKNPFKYYSTSDNLKQSRHHIFIEKPAMYINVPHLNSKSVLCLGCGSGEECEFLLSKKPASIIGVDISKELIKIAKRKVPLIEFHTMDAENLKFQDDSFDFIYSSMVLDYFESWDRLLKGVFRVLKKDGTFLFSNIHPIKWGAKISNAKGAKKTRIMGFDEDPKTKKIHIYGDYLNTKLHKKIWINNLPIYYYTKPISQMFSEITKSGLKVTRIIEPKAIPRTKKYDKNYWKLNQKIPSFIIFETKKT